MVRLLGLFCSDKTTGLDIGYIDHPWGMAKTINSERWSTKGIFKEFFCDLARVTVFSSSTPPPKKTPQKTQKTPQQHNNNNKKQKQTNKQNPPHPPQKTKQTPNKQTKNPPPPPPNQNNPMYNYFCKHIYLFLSVMTYFCNMCYILKCIIF